MSDEVRVEFLDRAALDSVFALPEPHQTVAWDLIEHLKGHPRFGKPLENGPAGDLSDARSLYVIDFDEREIAHPPPYRVVYRLLPSEQRPRVAQIVWADERNALAVYRVAARRLRRV